MNIFESIIGGSRTGTRQLYKNKKEQYGSNTDKLYINTDGFPPLKPCDAKIVKTQPVEKLSRDFRKISNPDALSFKDILEKRKQESTRDFI